MMMLGLEWWCCTLGKWKDSEDRKQNRQALIGCDVRWALMEAQLFLGSRTEKELVIDRKFEFNIEHIEIEIPIGHPSDMQWKWALRYMGLKHGGEI